MPQPPYSHNTGPTCRHLLHLLILLLYLVSLSWGQQKPQQHQTLQQGVVKKQVVAVDNERSESSREPLLVKVSNVNRQPEKRGTVRLTTIPGENTFPYRFVYPVGQPSYTQYAAYTTPRSAPIYTSSSTPSASPIKYAYPLPTTMLLVMAHPHASAPYGGTFMLIPASQLHQLQYSYNPVPQGRVSYAYLAANNQYLKPNYIPQQFLYKTSSGRAPNHNYNSASSEENESLESSTVSNYGSRQRSAEQYIKG